jgi:hypothetical protein
VSDSAVEATNRNDERACEVVQVEDLQRERVGVGNNGAMHRASTFCCGLRGSCPRSGEYSAHVESGNRNADGASGRVEMRLDLRFRTSDFRFGFSRFLASYFDPPFSSYPLLYTWLFNVFSAAHRVEPIRT